MIVARTTEGEIGILPGHEPVLGLLVTGQVTIRTNDGNTVLAAVHGGFLSVSDDAVSILAEVAELADEIDVPRAEDALQRAQGDDDAGEQRRRAETRLRVARAR
jgi:F-type H+-transporting ATPase subunit epsilon